MMSWKDNISLKKYNTFGIDALARHFAIFDGEEQLAGLLEQATGFGHPPARSPRTSADLHQRPIILGGGSNILLTGDVDGLVLKNEIGGIDVVHEDEQDVYVKAGAGEPWHSFVQYCLGRNLAGVENLSLIPGSVGAAPMQNIGAYGVEIKEVFHELEAWSLEDRKVYIFTLNDCRFGYRDSVFKGEQKGKFIILNVTFRLSKTAVFHTEYGAIREELDRMGIQELSIRAISQAVIHIRSAKLPDPAQIGNAGSFFKNPTIPGDQFTALQAAFPGIVGYPAPSDQPPGQSSAAPSPAPAGPASTGTPGPTKLAAGWLIEQCGWKGYRRGDAGCHGRQALVLVNYGNATGHEIYDLSEEILVSVRQKFGVTLEREVNIL